MRWNCPLALLFTFALSSAASASAIWLEGSYGQSSTTMTDLNDYRSAFKWNNTTLTEGSLKAFDYLGASVGHHFLFHTILSVRYETQGVHLPETSIAGASYSVADVFVYEPLYLNLDLPVHIGSWIWTVGGGVGYALNYQYHQKETGGFGEDVIWQAHPIGTRGRTSLAYRLGSHFAIFAEAFYESVKSELKAFKNYQTTSNGSPIQRGQQLTNPVTGQPVQADLSGLRYGLGLRLMF